MNRPFKVLITTSGLGSRLGNLTEFTNKSLIVVGKKTALSHIIDAYPVDTQFVITLGHFGSHVKQYLELAYPNTSFAFVEVFPYKGAGSSLAFSMLQAKDYLQTPFIYHASDSIVIEENLPPPTRNWVAGQRSIDGTNYASFDSSFSSVSKFHDKGMVNFDYLHIGVIGIRDYELFWKSLELAVSKIEVEDDLNDLSALKQMLDDGINFEVIEVSNWFDIGNSHALMKAREHLSFDLEVLQKSNESISFVNGKVIKFFSDSTSCKNRVIRAEDLKPLVPSILSSAPNFYTYEFVSGEVASRKRSHDQILKLLDWAKLNLWISRTNLSYEEFTAICKNFYLGKSQKRISDFISTRGVKEVPLEINGQMTPPALDMLEDAVTFVMDDQRQTRIHGDFILDNIVVTKKGFMLIDWRQDFGGSLESGDLYYDLSKLNHSLHVNHEIVKRNLFDVELVSGRVECGIYLKDSLIRMKDCFDDWLDENCLSRKKVDILTSLIWLNMAPLHHHPFDQFLYYYGRYNLWRQLRDY